MRRFLARINVGGELRYIMVYGKFCVVLILLTALSVGAENEPCNWPQFHGPRRDNLSDDTGLMKRWPDGGPRLIWKADGIGHGFSSVSVVNGMIYTAGNIEGETFSS